MDGLVERVGIGEGLVGKVVGLEIAPDGFDVVQLRRVFGQPLDGEPMGPGGECSLREFAGMDWTIVLDQHHRLCRLRTVEPVQLFGMGNEVTAPLGLRGVHDELARLVIERSQHRDFLRLPRRRNAQVGSRLRPGAGEVGMRQCLAFVAVEQNDVAGCGLLFEKMQVQADPFDLGIDLAPLQRVPRASPAELFFEAPLTIANG